MNKYLASILVWLIMYPAAFVWAQTDKNQVPAAKTQTQKKLAPVKTEPVNGAFGIRLGVRFKPSMVTRVLSEKRDTYRAAKGLKREGSIYHVQPSKPDKRFQGYSIKTTSDGIIYAIQGEYQYQVEPAQGKKLGQVKSARVVRATCKAAVKSLAEELEMKYGKPRGKGWEGEWFSFRQSSENENKSLRLYANRCRTGLYSIVYTDEKAQKG